MPTRAPQSPPWRAIPWLICAAILGLALLLLFARLGDGSLYDWDEAIYAQAAREMWRSGAWDVVTWQGYPFFHKPPLYFWLTALAYRCIGVSELAARLWAALFGFGTVALTLLFGIRLRTWPIGATAALLLLVVDPAYYSQWWNFLSLSRVGMMDAPLTFWVTLALLLRWEAQRRPWCLMLIGLPAGLAVLTKAWPGLLAPLIAGLYGLLRGRGLEAPRAYWGVAGLLAAALIVPWHLWQYHLFGQPFLREYVGFNVVERLIRPLEGHDGGVFFYAQVVRRGFSLWGYLWPPAALWAAWRAWRHADRGALLLLCWMLVPLALFSAAQTKIGWYMAVIYPAVALAIAGALADWLTPRLAFGVVLAGMLVCCLRLPAPADGSPDVKRLALQVAHHVPAGEPVYVVRPTCAAETPGLTAGSLLASDAYIRPAMVFAVDRPLRCLADTQIAAGLLPLGGYAVVDRHSWLRLQQPGELVSPPEGHGYLLIRWRAGAATARPERS
jgi:4-amino-4-deoxy-L-arabinose transferase-like glycosyltransferase